MSYIIEVLLRDAKGLSAPCSVRVPEGFTLAQYQAFAQTFTDAVLLVTGGGVQSVSLSLDIDISAVAQVGKPTVLSDVEEMAEFIVRTNSGYRAFIGLPTYDENHTLAASDVLDPADAAVLAFTQALTSGLASASPCDIGDDDIVQVLSALERFRNSGVKR